MSSDKQLAPNTPNGLFAFTLNPNNFVDAVKLETDFKSIYLTTIIGDTVQNGEN